MAYQNLFIFNFSQKYFKNIYRRLVISWLSFLNQLMLNGILVYVTRLVHEPLNGIKISRSFLSSLFCASLNNAEQHPSWCALVTQINNKDVFFIYSLVRPENIPEMDPQFILIMHNRIFYSSFSYNYITNYSELISNLYCWSIHNYNILYNINETQQ